MSSGNDREERFAAILDAVDAGEETLTGQALAHAADDPELSAALALTARLRRVSVPRAERDSARLAIGQRLARAILSGDGERSTGVRRAARRLRPSFPAPVETPRDATPVEPATAPVPAIRAFTHPHQRDLARGRVYRRQIALGAIAAVVALLALASGLTALSASSLPESPLYGIKRFEEAASLALPVGDAAHADLLASFAMRRLNEAQIESRERHDSEATTLLNEYNTDMLQLVLIAAKSRSDTTDSGTEINQIAVLLQAQESARQAAASRGDTAFSQALTASAMSIRGALQQNDVTLPPLTATPTRTPNSQGSGGATPTPVASATPNPGAGHGNGHGHGAGNPGAPGGRGGPGGSGAPSGS